MGLTLGSGGHPFVRADRASGRPRPEVGCPGCWLKPPNSGHWLLDSLRLAVACQRRCVLKVAIGAKGWPLGEPHMWSGSCAAISMELSSCREAGVVLGGRWRNLSDRL